MAVAAADKHGARLTSILHVTNWEIWRLNLPALCFYLAVDLLAIAATVLGFLMSAPTLHQWTMCGILLILGIAQAEANRRGERIRRRINVVHHVNLTSVWSFAAVLLLPPGIAYAVPWLLYAHMGLRSWLGVRAPHRQFFSAAAVVITAPITQLLFYLVNGSSFAEASASRVSLLIATAVAGLAYSGIDLLVVGFSVRLRAGAGEFRAYFGDFANHGLDLATNCLGAFVALSLVYQPLFVLLLLVPVLIIHRSVLVKEMEDKAIRDQKTGLLNATAWNDYANRELARAERTELPFGLLMVDLDHFKRINDTYGHPAGDDVLVAVSTVLKNETRQYDSAGRFGGEEFAVLLPGTVSSEVAMVAERIRSRISALTIETVSENGPITITNQSASLGVALYPDHGRTLDELVRAADAALYTAKRSGRNQVVGIPIIPEQNQRAS